MAGGGCEVRSFRKIKAFKRSRVTWVQLPPQKTSRCQTAQGPWLNSLWIQTNLLPDAWWVPTDAFTWWLTAANPSSHVFSYTWKHGVDYNHIKMILKAKKKKDEVFCPSRQWSSGSRPLAFSYFRCCTRLSHMLTSHVNWGPSVSSFVKLALMPFLRLVLPQPSKGWGYRCAPSTKVLFGKELTSPYQSGTYKVLAPIRTYRHSQDDSHLVRRPRVSTRGKRKQLPFARQWQAPWEWKTTIYANSPCSTSFCLLAFTPWTSVH